MPKRPIKQCPRPFCGGQLLTQLETDAVLRIHAIESCLLCARGPDAPKLPGQIVSPPIDREIREAMQPSRDREEGGSC